MQTQQGLDEKSILQSIYAFLERAKLDGNEVKVYNQCITYLENIFTKVEQKSIDDQKKNLEKETKTLRPKKN
jgi:DNA-binding ferritin-like protein (Dps family)